MPLPTSDGFLELSISGPAVADPNYIELYVSGPGEPLPSDPAGLDLYISGPGEPAAADPAGLDLYVSGPGEPELSDPAGLDLYLSGPAVSDPWSLELYLPGASTDDAFGGVDLYVRGVHLQEADMPLSTVGVGSGQRAMNLVLFDPAPGAEGSLPLYVGGSGEAQAVGRSPFYLLGSDQPTHRQMALYLHGSPTDSTVRSMNLWVRGEAQQEGGVLPFFLHCEGADGSVPLFMAVEGELVGGQVASSSMPLFLKRPFEAAVSLYLGGPGTPHEGSMTLFTAGLDEVDEQVPLAVPSVLGVGHETLELIVAGW